MSIESNVLAYKSRFSPVEFNKRTASLPLEPDFVLVKTAYAALNPVDMQLKAVSFFGGKAVGFDYSGEIVEVASNLDGQFAKGERVCGALVEFGETKSFVGSYTLVNVKRQSIIKTPLTLNDEEAAALPLVFQTVLNILPRTNLDANSRVLILGGATAVGSVLIEVLSKVHHIRDIVVTCSPRSASYVKELGASEVIDYSCGDLSEKLVQSANHGKYQAIIDTVGGYAALKVWKKILKPIQDSSVYVTINSDADPAKSYSGLLSFDLLSSLPRMVFRMLFGRWLGINYQLMLTHDNTPFNKSADTIAEQNIKVRIDSVYPFAEAKKAWDKVDKFDAKGKVLLKF